MAPAQLDPQLRGDRSARGNLLRPRRHQGAAHRRRAAAASRPPHAGPAALRASTRSRDLALTTNGVLLARQAEALRAAGLRRVTVSLDTLRPERMREFARSTRHDDVIAGIDAAPCRRLPLGQAQHRRHPGIQRRRDPGPARLRVRPRPRAPLHRVHGRRRRHRLVDGAGRVATRDRRDGGAPVRRGEAGPADHSGRPPSSSRCPTAARSA